MSPADRSLSAGGVTVASGRKTRVDKGLFLSHIRTPRPAYFHEAPQDFAERGLLYHPVKPDIPEWTLPPRMSRLRAGMLTLAHLAAARVPSRH